MCGIFDSDTGDDRHQHRYWVGKLASVHMLQLHRYTASFPAHVVKLNDLVWYLQRGVLRALDSVSRTSMPPLKPPLPPAPSTASQTSVHICCGHGFLCNCILPVLQKSPFTTRKCMATCRVTKRRSSWACIGNPNPEQETIEGTHAQETSAYQRRPTTQYAAQGSNPPIGQHVDMHGGGQ